MTQLSADLAAALSTLDARLGDIGGCSDGYCVIIKPKGMHTNGGCWCFQDRVKMQRLARAYNEFRACIAKHGARV